jgi:hypothetical protein
LLVASRSLGLVGCLALAALGASCEPHAEPRPERRATSAVLAKAPGPFPPAERDHAVAEGRRVLEKHQCTRCHAIDKLPPGARPLHCTSCHLFLTGLRPGERRYEEIASKYGRPIIERYQRNIVHLKEVPDLTGLGARVRPEWIGTFLAEPFDVRPVLGESMFRHTLSEEERRAVVRYFAAVADVADPYAPSYAPAPLPARPTEARVHAGRTLFLEKGCGKCHTFGNVPFGVTAQALEASRSATALAPNLRFVRERMAPATVARWIRDPKSVQASAVMPAQQLSDEELGRIVDFLFFGDPELGAAPELRTPTVVPAAHPVSWEEVKDRVLGKVCVHCHMNDYEKDKGPGNQGGLGYAGIGLAMRTYEALVWGAIDRSSGGRYSVLVPRDGERYSPLVEALRRRRVEAARDQVPAFADHERPAFPPGAAPGMPLGLPAMTDEEIGLVQRWIDDGCPGPTKVWGMAGVYDGLLVPDGPIAKNQGCELRAPSAARPAWAVETERTAEADDGKAAKGKDAGAP